MNTFFKKITIIVFLISIFTTPISIQTEERVFLGSSLSTVDSIKITASLKTAYADIGDPPGETVGTTGFLECSWYDTACHGINFLQIIFVTVGNFLVGLAAFFMDIFLFHSLQSGSYSGSGFIEAGWEILRDLTNIIFIFALLLIAFNLVLGRDENGNKSRLIKTVLIALTINFSLFLSYAIIDASNLLAFTFYNKIEQNSVTFQANSSTTGENNNTADEIETTDSTFKGKSVSLAIAAKINPQQLLGEAGDQTSKGERTLLVIMAGIINGTLIYVFLSVSFLFLGRTIGLWLSAVLAPLAFASLTVPALQDIKYIGFSKWLNSLLQMAFMAPVFLFFLYLAVQFMNVATVSIAGVGTGSGDFVTRMLGIVVPMAAIVMLILTAKKVANSMSGDFAGTISGFVAKAAGGVATVGAIAATGGASLAAGGLGAAARGAGSAIGKNAAAGSTSARFANVLKSGGKMAQSANFNFGQSRIGKAATAATGINMGANLGNMSYARLDTAARTRANNIRGGVDDMLTGKTSASVQGWQDDIKASENKLAGRRIENAQREAAAKLDPVVVRGYESDGTTINTAEGQLQNLEARLGRRSSVEAKAEKDNLDAQKEVIQSSVETKQDFVNNLAKKKNKTDAEKNDLKTKRKEILDLKNEIKKVDETSLTGQIAQIKKQLDNAKTTARADLLKNDRRSRTEGGLREVLGRMTQDSSLTPSSEILGRSREQRLEEVASRVGNGEISSTPNVGGDANA